MPRKELERQIARHTGEDLCEIRRLGFSLIDLTDDDFDPQPDYPPQMVDWDELDRERWAV
jgi:hypothetical protein